MINNSSIYNDVLQISNNEERSPNGGCRLESAHLPEELDKKTTIRKSLNKNRVTFNQEHNKIILIHDLSFYIDNNIKQDIWWTFTEINTMRKFVSSEITRLKLINPKWTVQKCIHRICT